MYPPWWSRLGNGVPEKELPLVRALFRHSGRIAEWAAGRSRLQVAVTEEREEHFGEAQNVGDFVQGRVEVLVPLALLLSRGGSLGTHLNEAKHRPVVLVQLAMRGVGQRLRRGRGPLACVLFDSTKIRVGFGFRRNPSTLALTLHPKPGLSDRTKIRMSVL